MDDPLFSPPPINKAVHLRYWQRCLRTLLPHHYTPTDSQRMTLGFFIITAIDLLSPSTITQPPEQRQQQEQQQAGQPSSKPTPVILTPTDRRNLRQWVLSCQHPQGGFCGSPTHVLPPQNQDTANANIAATYFALLLLAILADDDDDDDGGGEGAFSGVNRVKTLRWLRTLQRPGDGSFGEVVYELPQPPAAGGGSTVLVGGGKDMRYCYLAATVRWMLRGGGDDIAPGGEGYVEDIDIDALVAHIRRSQTYDGGFSESYRHESHAGYGYCAVAALALLDRPLETPDAESGGEAQAQAQAQAGAEQTPYYKRSQALQKGISDIPGFISFLVSRQFIHLESSRDDDGDDDDDDDDPETANFQLANLSLSGPDDGPLKHIGFNGRCNKVADTCYTWWVLGSLSILGVLHPSATNNNSDNKNNTVDPAALKAQRDFLLDKTQHAIGGFGKRPGDPPDIYHSSLGLAALATLGDPALKRFDPGLCVSADTVRKIEKGRRGLTRRANNRGGAGAAAAAAAADSSSGSVSGSRADFGKGLLDMAVSMRGGERPEWLVG